MGLAIGAGFYECVLLGFVLIFLTNRLLPFVEEAIIENARNMNIYVEFQTLDDLGDIIGRIKSQGYRSMRWIWTGDGRSGPKTQRGVLHPAAQPASPRAGPGRPSPSWRACMPLTRFEGGERVAADF